MKQSAPLSRREMLRKGSLGMAALAIGPSLLSISRPLSCLLYTSDAADE